MHADGLLDRRRRLIVFMGVASLIVGMMPAMLVAIVGMGRLWGERRWPLLGASGVGLSLAIYFVFIKRASASRCRAASSASWLF